MQQYEPDKNLLSGYMRQRRSHRRWRRAAVVLSILAVFITMSLMTLPAITMEGSPEPLHCQLSLHQHTADCYDADGSLVCGYADFVVHTHTEDCYQGDTLICPLDEIQLHTHTEACYGGEPTPVLTCELEEGGHIHDESCYTAREGAAAICGLEESEGHTHGEDCYTPGEPVLTCALEEAEGHVHGETCYDENGALICSLTESEGHAHSEACYAVQEVLACTQAEAEGHVHSLDCYAQEDWVLSCGQQEGHVHTEACYTLQETLTCGQEEIILHTHDAGCYDDHGVLSCGLLEVTEHIHDASCFPAADEEELQIPDNTPPAGDVSTEDPVESTDPDVLPGESPEASQEPAESEPPEIIQSGTSWATAEKLPANSGLMSMPAMMGITDFPGAANGILTYTSEAENVDLADHRPTVPIEHNVNGTWTPVDDGSTIVDGSGIRVTISYSLASGVITSAGQTLYYQLPAGVHLDTEERGSVMSDGKEVGTYTISTTGQISIKFDDTFITGEGHGISGSIQFQGTVSLADIEDGDQLTFGGTGTTITVEEGEKAHDLNVTKTGTHTGNGTISYTVTVSTQDGTDGAITITDTFLHDTSYASVTYRENSFTITGPNGTMTDPSIVIDENDTGSFTISDLPALEAGQKYTITYTAAVDMGQAPGDANGYLEVSNQVTAQAGEDSATADATVKLYDALLTKTGTYNPATGMITWTITINAAGRDIGGWTLTDTMTWTYNGNTYPATLPDTITVNGEAMTVDWDWASGYTFPDGSTGTYTITYETPLPEGAAEGQNLTATNTVSLGNYQAQATVDITVPGTYDVVKASWGVYGDTTDTSATMQWVSFITYPQGGLNVDNLNNIAYIDILTDVLKADNSALEKSHYTTRSMLARSLSVGTYDGTTVLQYLAYGTDYEVYAVTYEDFRRTLATAFEDYHAYAVYEYLMACVSFDEMYHNGFTVDNTFYKFNWQEISKIDGDTPLAMFAVVFNNNALDELNSAACVGIYYHTQVDISGAEAGQELWIGNIAKIPGKNTAASANVTRPEKTLDKQVSATGVDGTDTSSYGDGLTTSYDATNGVLHYRILLTGYEDSMTVTDTLPVGATLIPDSVRLLAHYSNSGSYEDEDLYGTFLKGTSQTSNNDGTTTVTFTLQNLDEVSYYDTIGIYYSVSVADDTFWDENTTGSKDYTNTAAWGDLTDNVTATVSRSLPVVEKTGTATTNGDGSTTIRYYVVVNPEGEDLDPNRQILSLTDTLTLGNPNAQANLRLETVALYAYDPNVENNCGERLDSSVFNVTTGKDYTVTFTVPDETPCVVAYDYVIDRGSAAGDFSVINTAQLAGVSTAGAGDQITVADSTSSATVSKATLTIYKADAENETQLLSGAQFKLEVYIDGQWTAVDLEGQVTGGAFTIDKYIDLNFLEYQGDRTNILFRIIETQAPEGYELDDAPRYFVWMDQGMDAAATLAAMQEAGAIPDGVDTDQITFIRYSTSGTITITNTPSDSGYVLPETGGMGTTLWTAGGLGLIALASLMYLILRRKGG